MFAMLAGPWPRTTADGTRLADLEAGVAAGQYTSDELAAAVERAVADAVAAQAEAGMGILTDGLVRWADPAAALLGAMRAGDLGGDGMLVRAWRAAAAPVEALVAAVITGPWTLATIEAQGRGGGDATLGAAVERRAGDGLTATTPGADGPVGATPEIARRALEIAGLLADELQALASIGCPVVVVLEPELANVGEDPGRRAGFLDAHRRLLSQAPDLHAMLAVLDGQAVAAGPETVFGAPYASHLFDLIAGPDDWQLVRAAPPERGIVCAALVAGGGAEARDQAPQLMWAAHYAASAAGRGLDRVGIANASPLDSLEPAGARMALASLGRAAALATMPTADALEAGLDPRAVVRMPVHGPLPRRERKRRR
jgi:hypothetical protein